MFKKLLVLISTIGLVSMAYATPVQNSFNGVKAGPYIGIAGGYGGMYTPELNKDARQAADHQFSEDRMGFAGRANVGYLWSVGSPNLKLGTEIGFNHYPDNKYKLGPKDEVTNDTHKWTYKGYSVDALGVAHLNLNSGFSLIGKAGVAYVHQEVTREFTYVVSSQNSSASSTKNKVLPEAAAGFGYDFTQNFGMNLTYNHIFGSTPKAIVFSQESLKGLDDVASVNMLTLGIDYHFA